MTERELRAWICVALLTASTMILGVLSYKLGRLIHQTASQMSNEVIFTKEEFKTYRQGWEAIAAKGIACQEKLNSVVVLYEQTPAAKPTQLFGGLVALAPGSAFGGRSMPRWWVQAGEPPEVIGKPQGAAIAFWDPKTKTFTAPRPAPQLHSPR